MIGNCKDCKHWGGPVDLADSSNRRACQRLITMDHVTNRSPLVEFDVCTDHEHYGVGLRSAAEFGCVLFEASDPKPHCPICGGTDIRTKFRPNHIPETDVTGNLRGFRHGTPTASVTCAAGCHVAVRGQVQVSELAKMMGLPLETKDEG